MNWPDTGPTLTCPLCRGPIAYWVLQPLFTCHHCKKALLSNHRQVQGHLIIGTVVAWGVAALALALAAQTQPVQALLIAGQVVVPLGFFVEWPLLKRLVTLAPQPSSSRA